MTIEPNCPGLLDAGLCTMHRESSERNSGVTQCQRYLAGQRSSGEPDGSEHHRHEPSKS
jgi:hypothetical protein